MSHEFQNTLHPTTRAMCDAIAYEWMTAGGANSPASIDAMTQSAQHHAEECIEGWNLLAPTESGNDWLADRDSSAAEVLEAFERFLHTRPDRPTTKADEHAILLNNCAGIVAFEQAVSRAAREAVDEETTPEDGRIVGLTFADGSRIAMDYSARAATVET